MPALAGGLLALALPVLSGCGSFDYATDRPNVIANGGYSLDSDIRINAARIVTPQEGSGTFIATFDLNPTVNVAGGQEKPRFTGLQPAEGATTTVEPRGSIDIPISDGGMINLADPKVGGVAVTGDFKPGDTVPLTLSFSSGEQPVTVQVPVVTQCGPYASVVPQGKPHQAMMTPPTGDQSTNPYSCDYPPASLPSE
jgi:hypothetical protein